MDPNPEINPAAAKGFESSADSYERGRPDYPATALDHLVRALGIGPGSRVLDLGAGTGKFTRQLLPTGARLAAVEPVKAMRIKFASVLPGIEISAGTAEKIPAPDSTFDAVVAAQSFHWFAGGPALRGIHRVLKPGGKLGLLWNVRDESREWVSRLSGLLKAHEGDVPRYGAYGWKEAFGQNPAFTPLEKRSFRHVQWGSVGTVLDLVRSRSYIAALPEGTREAVLGEVRELLESNAQTKGRAKIEVPYITDVYCCSKK